MKTFKILVVTAFLFIACVDDVDFDQVDDIEINTSHLITLVHFNADTTYFLDDFGNESLFISDTTELPIFEGTYNENYLIQADFQFVLSNTFDRDITFQFEFLDINDNEIYQFNPLLINPIVSPFDETQTIFEPDIPLVLPTEKVVINIRLDAGSTPLNPDLGMDLNFQSALTLHYQITGDEQ